MLDGEVMTNTEKTFGGIQQTEMARGVAYQSNENKGSN